MAATTRTLADLIRPVGNRSLHLRIVPRPQNIAESRAILRLIQRYGEVEMFKSLRYDKIPTPNAALVIMKSSETTRKLLYDSPLRFVMERDEDGVMREQQQEEQGEQQPSTRDPTMMSQRRDIRQNVAAIESQQFMPKSNSGPSPRPSAPTGAWGLPQTQSRNLSTSQRQGARPGQQPRGRTSLVPEEGPREYQIQVNVATFNHRDHLNVNPYNGTFAVDTKSAIQEDLAKRVPLVGLSDLNLKKEEKPWRVLAWQRKYAEQARRPLRKMLEEGRKT